MLKTIIFLGLTAVAILIAVKWLIPESMTDREILRAVSKKRRRK